jgi:hypothetical protein
MPLQYIYDDVLYFGFPWPHSCAPIHSLQYCITFILCSHQICCLQRTCWTRVYSIQVCWEKYSQNVIMLAFYLNYIAKKHVEEIVHYRWISYGMFRCRYYSLSKKKWLGTIGMKAGIFRVNNVQGLDCHAHWEQILVHSSTLFFFNFPVLE